MVIAEVTERVLEDRQTCRLAHRQGVVERDQPSELMWVRDDHVGSSLRYDVEDLRGQPGRLIGGDPHAGPRPEVGESGDVVHVDRLLDELDADVLETTQGIDGLEDRPPLVGVDSQGNRLAHLVLDRPGEGQIGVEVEADLDVDRAESALDALRGLPRAVSGLRSLTSTNQ